FAVEVTVSNRDRHLKPGMIASVGLGEVPHSSISIPLSAIVPLPSEPDHFAVMVAQDRAGRLVANLRKVQLGTTHDNSVAVEGVQHSGPGCGGLLFVAWRHSAASRAVCHPSNRGCCCRK